MAISLSRCYSKKYATPNKSLKEYVASIIGIRTMVQFHVLEYVFLLIWSLYLATTRLLGDQFTQNKKESLSQEDFRKHVTFCQGDATSSYKEIDLSFSFYCDRATHLTPLLAPVVQRMFNGCSGVMFYGRVKICFNVQFYGRSAIKHRKPCFDCDEQI